MSRTAFLLAVASVAVAQTPAFMGALNLNPGNSAGKCITAASNTNGAIVTIQSCTGADAQKWTFNSGAVKIFGSKCLDVTGGSTANGVKLQIWDCVAGSTNQKFYYTPWGDNHLAWTDHGKCLDLTDGSLADGNRPQLWDCSGSNPNQVWNAGYQYNQLPAKTQSTQTGTNACGTGSSDSSQCQTAWINSIDDFCLWGPPTLGSVGDTEHLAVAYCNKRGRGTRTFPDGTLKGVHFVQTEDYVQITGVGDFTKINIRAGDEGGELDPHGADNNGNPAGGLLFGSTFGSNLQYHEWTSFISAGEFCIRACVGPNARRNCAHIYDVMGCYWNMPGKYDAGSFDTCKGKDTEPMGVYGTSTWYQGVSPTPAAHAPGASSSCTSFSTIGTSDLKQKRETGFEKARRANAVVEAFPTPTPTS